MTKQRPRIAKERVIFLLREGYQRQDIAKLLGIGRTTLWRRMKDWGLDKDEAANMDAAALTEMRKTGMSWREIANVMGVCPRHVFRLRRDLETKAGIVIE